MSDEPRLIEAAFPLRQASLDSVREKYGPKGHISGFHLWPARRPLAACRAVLVYTLLSNCRSDSERSEILERLAGRVVQKIKRRKLPSGKVEETVVEETDGGILRWGRESGPGLVWFQQKIRESYGGRAPRVLDPFAGGGAIPFEAMRLGCEATAIDINPVAWFILKCTLEHPQKLAGETLALPKFVLGSPHLIEEYRSARRYGVATRNRGKGSTESRAAQEYLVEIPKANLAWHLRAWGRWVLNRACADLDKFYPVVDGKPTAAYLWARTVRCRSCRATIPLLKTRWLSKKDDKRVLLGMKPNTDRTGVVFEIQNNVPVTGGNAAQRRDSDRNVGAGTMSRSGASCPCCGTIMTMADIRLEGQAGRLGKLMTAVVADGARGKEYRLPTEAEIQAAHRAAGEVERVFGDVPFGLPVEPLAGKEALGFRVPLYGFDQWHKLFTPRQLVALGTFIRYIRAAREEMCNNDYPTAWLEAIYAYLAASLDRLVDHSTTLATWYVPGENVKHTFVRYALPITWDFAESNPLFAGGGSWSSAISFCSAALDHALRAADKAPEPIVALSSATNAVDSSSFDLIVTDPPYYDAIPYSDLMDLFYVWLRRIYGGLDTRIASGFLTPLGPKWDSQSNDGELVDDASRFGGDKTKSKAAYEDGMFRAFQMCQASLAPGGRLVIVFAHKQPDAWEALVSGIIKAGFVTDASWPVQTENVTRSRARASAALASSVWLVCKKRSETARPGWDNIVLNEMREKIQVRLRKFWDAGVRGPDFVWAATGPALEAYSKHPVVKKANNPGEIMTVSEFLHHVRRLVVDFVVGRVLSRDGGDETTIGLDDVTTYYLLHRHDFKLEDAPIGACILYAISCGLSDSSLVDQYDVLVRAGGRSEIEDEEEDEETEDAEESPTSSGSKVRLKPWNQRKRKGMGYETPGGRPVPLIDQVHRLMHLWKASDVARVDEYLATRGLRRNALFHQLLQALIELAPHGSEERSLLESISNHVVSRGALPQEEQMGLTTS